MMLKTQLRLTDKVMELKVYLIQWLEKVGGLTIFILLVFSNNVLNCFEFIIGSLF